MERQSNFELLRIILMITVPLYHLMLYGQMNYLPFHKFTIPSLLICSGGAIVADYAFMALSAYFFIQCERRSVLHRFLNVFIQILFIYGIKMLILRVGLGTKGKNPIFEDFFVRGAWWFIYAYLIIMLIYPILNKLIYTLNLTQLRMVCIILGLGFFMNGVLYEINHFNDLMSFVFVYFVIGYLKRTEFRLFLGLKNCKKTMFLTYLIGYIVTFVVSLIIKWPGNIVDCEQASQLLLRFNGRYAFIQFVMGIAVFLLFHSIKIPVNKWINKFAGNVFYVFLLHETVMAVFWKLDMLNVVDGKLPYTNGASFVFWSFVYLMTSLLFAMIIRWMYEGLFKKTIDKIASAICTLNWVQKVEEKYLDLTKV